MTYIKDKVSVIIPTYGRSKLLAKSIESVLSQSYKNIEIIIVDDNGKETPDQIETEKVVMSFSSDKLEYIILDQNKGGSFARNIGAKRADGEFLCFLDDDDLFLPTKVESQHEFLKNSVTDKYIACYCSHIRINNIKNSCKEYIATCFGDIRIPVLKFAVDACSGSTLMLYHSVFDNLNGFTPDLARFQDYEFLARLSFLGNIGVIKSPQVIINVHEGSYALKTIKKIEEARLYYLEIVSDLIMSLPKVKAKEIININYIFLLKESLKRYKLLYILKYTYKISWDKKLILSLFQDIYKKILK